MVLHGRPSGKILTLTTLIHKRHSCRSQIVGLVGASARQPRDSLRRKISIVQHRDNHGDWSVVASQKTFVMHANTLATRVIALWLASRT